MRFKKLKKILAISITIFAIFVGLTIFWGLTNSNQNSSTNNGLVLGTPTYISGKQNTSTLSPDQITPVPIPPTPTQTITPPTRTQAS